MTKPNFLLSLGLFVFIFSNQLFAQSESDMGNVTPMYTYTSFLNPEPAEFAPIEIDANSGNMEVENSKGQAGFERAYFSTNTINRMLEEPNCVGIRFYNAIHRTMGTPTVIAIGINSMGEELDNSVQNYMESNGVNSNDDATDLTKLQAKSSVNNLKSQPSYKSYTVYYSKTALKKYIFTSGATGIVLMPGMRKFTNSNNQVESRLTMMISPVSVVDNNLQLQGGGKYFKSIEPCPYICGELHNYAVSPE